LKSFLSPSVANFVKSLEVTNDCAERGVKIINDFKDVTEDEEQLQYALLSYRTPSTISSIPQQ
jgi:hypothetical protein